MNLVDEVRGWIESLDASRLDVDQLVDEFGLTVSIRPRNPKGCCLSVQADRVGTASFECGRTIKVSDWAVDSNMLIAILDAVRAGRIQEEIWELCGHTMKGSGVIYLEDGEEIRDRLLGLPLGKRRLLRYEPW
jgi:hypothetical protein